MDTDSCWKLRDTSVVVELLPDRQADMCEAEGGREPPAAWAAALPGREDWRLPPVEDQLSLPCRQRALVSLEEDRGRGEGRGEERMKLPWAELPTVRWHHCCCCCCWSSRSAAFWMGRNVLGGS